MIRLAFFAIGAFFVLGNPVSAQSNMNMSALLAQGYKIVGQSSSTYTITVDGQPVQRIRVFFTLVRDANITLCSRDVDPNASTLSGAICGALH